VEANLKRKLQEAGLKQPVVVAENLNVLPRHPETKKLKRSVPMPR